MSVMSIFQQLFGKPWAGCATIWPSMKKLGLTTALTILFVGAQPALPASANPTAQQLLITATQQANFFGDQGNPVQLDVDFVAQINGPNQGHLTLRQQGNDRWWRKIVMGDFEEIEIRNGDRFYTSRNIGSTPLRVRELISLLQVGEDAEGLLAKKQRQRVENGVEITCLQVERHNDMGKPHEFCMNSATHEIVSDEWQVPPDGRHREQYTDYLDFSGHRYPRKLQLVVNGIVVITANVDNLTTTAFDQRLLVPPTGAIERRHCTDRKPPIPIRKPNPFYPQSARHNRVTGDTTVAMTVLTDGSVSDVHLIGGAASSLDDAALQTLKSWTFKPSMCGADPVVSDIVVVVNFRLN
jgi:TonB family protein